MSTTKKINDEPSSADIEAEIRDLDAALDAENTALAKWEEANSAGHAVDYTEKPKRRNLIEVLRDRRANAVARKRRIEDRERLERLAEFRAKVEAEEAGDPERIRSLAEDVGEAMRAFVEACNARATRLAEARRNLIEMGVPIHESGAREPSPGHGGIAPHASAELAIGRTRLRKVDPWQVLTKMHEEIVRSHIIDDAERARAWIGGQFAGLSQTVPQSRPEARFFRTTTGGVQEYDREPNDVEWIGLAGEVTPEQADAIHWARDEEMHRTRRERSWR